MRFSIIFASLLVAAPALAAPIRHAADGSHPQKYQNRYEERNIEIIEERAPRRGRDQGGQDRAPTLVIEERNLEERTPSPSPSPSRGDQRELARTKKFKKVQAVKIVTQAIKSTKKSQGISEADRARISAQKMKEKAEARTKTKREVQA